MQKAVIRPLLRKTQVISQHLAALCFSWAVHFLAALLPAAPAHQLNGLKHLCVRAVIE